MQRMDMKTKKIILVGALAGITACTPQAWAQDANAQIEVDTPNARGETELRRDAEVDVDVDKKTSAKIENQRESRVLASNKASGLLGMEVKNQQNEKLGEIKDLVFD